MRLSATLRPALLAALAGLALAACKANPHDNARIPDGYSYNELKTHKFDGGEKDPYGNDKAGGEGGGEAAGGAGGEAPAKSAE